MTPYFRKVYRDFLLRLYFSGTLRIECIYVAITTLTLNYTNLCCAAISSSHHNVKGLYLTGLIYMLF
jgi:hypothetical protein